MAPWILPAPEDDTGDEEAADDTWAEEGYQRVSEPSRGVLTLGVLPENWVVVQVFRRCQPQLAVGMAVVWQGVSAREVHAACLLSRVPRREWPRFVDDVQLMAAVAAQAANEKSAAGGNGSAAPGRKRRRNG